MIRLNKVGAIAPKASKDIKKSRFVLDFDTDLEDLRTSGWVKPNGARALCYWNTNSNILTQTYEGTTTIRLRNNDAREPHIVDLLRGDVYEIPESMKTVDKGFTVLNNIPVTDYPLLLTAGDFI